MDKLRIEGGRTLRGRVEIGGAKNASLPELAAALLTDQPVRYRGVPALRDVRTMLRVLEQLGATVDDGGDGTVSIRFDRVRSFEAPYDLVKTMRASVLVLGPLLARYGKARVSLPGGCAIGERPIDIHLEGLAAFGADVELEHGYVEARCDRPRGTSFTFPTKTVTGTENMMMVAALARGDSVLSNCAQEPEIVDLAKLLSAMGAEIRGAGTDTIEIRGAESLHGAEHRVIPDRIEAGTYLVAAALVGDAVRVGPVVEDHLGAVLDQLRGVGVEIALEDEVATVTRPTVLRARDMRTAPHPGFPTDMQAQYMALATQSSGTTVIAETIFEHRFMHVSEMRRMGADIRIDGHSAVIVGPTPLTGAQVMATDLRASAGLVLAGLAADGVSVVDRVYHLDRGYEAMERKLGALGASVERIR